MLFPFLTQPFALREEQKPALRSPPDSQPSPIEKLSLQRKVILVQVQFLFHKPFASSEIFSAQSANEKNF